MKILKKFTAFIAVVFGLIFIAGGVWGLCFTYKSITSENIVTPTDAIIAEAPVRGPATLKAQADIIRQHTLTTTGGKTYAEMAREDDRSMWITATTLNTALYQGIIAYGLSAIAVANGIFMLLMGLLLCGKREFVK